MKTKNRHNRRVSALKRLELQISSRKPSDEFTASLYGKNMAAIEAATIAYWDKKDKEYSNLQKKLG